jgi:hypothetical protein
MSKHTIPIFMRQKKFLSAASIPDLYCIVSPKLQAHRMNQIFEKVLFRHLSWLLVGFAPLLIFACGKPKSEIVQEKASSLVAAFRVKKSAECREQLLAQAEKIVDSLLLAEAKDNLSDSLARLRPGRPVEPAAILPIDSLLVKPIFDQPRPASPTGGR